MKKNSKGFTLIEMLIVIGIIGLLVGAIMATFGSSTESANATKCMANMRSLAVASQNYLMANGQYPRAGSFEYLRVDGHATGGIKYYEAKGWISWRRAQPGGENSTDSKTRLGGTYITFDQGSASEENPDSRYAVTNGALWEYVKDLKCYTCPVHLANCRKRNNSKHYAWSYVMNSFFRHDVEGKLKSDGTGIVAGSIADPERMLLFAEMPAVENIKDVDQVAVFEGGGKTGDPVLNYADNERIGFNHVIAGKYVGHVVFADGHVAKMVAPTAGGLTIDDLTEELCQGNDVILSGSGYERVE